MIDSDYEEYVNQLDAEQGEGLTHQEAAESVAALVVASYTDPTPYTSSDDSVDEFDLAPFDEFPAYQPIRQRL